MTNFAHPFATPQDRARLTKKFIGIGYSEVTVRILHTADNAAIVADEQQNKRIILWKDMSWASEHVARQNQGAIVLLKIRAWS